MFDNERGHQFYGRIREFLQDSEGWVLPTLYPDDVVLLAYQENHHPTTLTKKLRHSKQFGIPKDFDSRNPAHLKELFCELFAGACLANLLVVESFVTSGRSVYSMARLLQIPTDNVKIRLVTYYLMRFPKKTKEDKASFDLLKAIEKKAWDFHLQYSQTTTEEMIKQYRELNLREKEAVDRSREKAARLLEEGWKQLEFPVMDATQD